MHRHARLAQLVERKALNLVVVGSSPTVGVFRPPTPFLPEKRSDHGRTRTYNLRFRRPTPYPLGHAAYREDVRLFRQMPDMEKFLFASFCLSLTGLGVASLV